MFILFCANLNIQGCKKHYNDTKLTLLEKFVQFSDIDNHETWVLFFLGIAIGMKINMKLIKQ